MRLYPLDITIYNTNVIGLILAFRSINCNTKLFEKHFTYCTDIRSICFVMKDYETHGKRNFFRSIALELVVRVAEFCDFNRNQLTKNKSRQSISKKIRCLRWKLNCKEKSFILSQQPNTK